MRRLNDRFGLLCARMNKASILRLSLIVACASLATSCSGPAKTPVSNINDDETVVFFRTAAWFDQSAQLWHVPIHGWIYEPEDSTARKKLFKEILQEKYGLETSAATESNFSRRINLIIADNERGKQIVITLAGREYQLPPSTPDGHFATTLPISAAEIERYARNGLLTYLAVTSNDDNREFMGEVMLVDPTGLSVISDIDDTVKISQVTDHKSLLDYTFLKDFIAAPGMSELYDHWSDQGASFHFVSSSPWQLYSPLREFLDDSSFPWATLSLKSVRFRDETFFNLFKKGTETKPIAIEAIFERYPERTFILVGDSGEQDPEVYAGILRKYPNQVKSIYIRNVTNESDDNARFTTLFGAVDDARWTLFDVPAIQ